MAGKWRKVILYVLIFKPRFITNHNGNGNEYSGGVRVRYNSLFISMPFFTKQQNFRTYIF